MGKRSDGAFERIERNFYATPLKPTLRLSGFLGDVEAFAEPFVGDGAWVRHLGSFGIPCVFASDIQPEGEARRYALTRDAMRLDRSDLDICGATHIISNPPWPTPRANGEPTVSLIWHLMRIRPTWLLLSADFAHNVYAPPLMRRCRKMVSVGRVKWIEGTKHDGKDNCAWYLFDDSFTGETVFHPLPLARREYGPEIEELL